MNLTVEQANEIYSILVREAGADNRAFHREMFIQVVTNPKTREYRFMGALGFGGKFWNYNNAWYVNAYPEDMNYATTGTVQTTNDALASLKASYDALAEALS